MENASKALIIAGAILISILLISVGIIIMNAINDPVSKGADAAESQAVQIFNSQFTGFMGTGVDYNTAKQFFTTVTSANTKAPQQITSTGQGITSIGELRRGHTYTITMTDTMPADRRDGYYDRYQVTDEQPQQQQQQQQ